jgi:hypothetical protein
MRPLRRLMAKLELDGPVDPGLKLEARRAGGRGGARGQRGLGDCGMAYAACTASCLPHCGGLGGGAFAALVGWLPDSSPQP